MSNPELRRNLWLEITPHRLLAMPLLLLLVFLAVFAMSDSRPLEALSWTGLSGFALLTLLWGSGLAANAYTEELTEKTWDWQRLSTLTPWRMTWGKLLGATAFAWVGGLLCLAVFIATAPADRFRAPLQLALTLVLLALMLHAMALAAAVHLSRRNPIPRQRGSVGLVGLVLMVLLALLGRFPFLFTGAPTAAPVQWYGLSLDGDRFVLLSVAFFALWAVVAAYRTLCQALAVRTAPTLWLAFIACAAFYTAGLIETSVRLSRIQALLFCALGWSLALSYLMLLTEPGGPVLVRRLWAKAALGQWRRLAEELPCWLPSALVALVCALALIGVHPGSALALPGHWHLLPLTLVLLLLRDAGLLMFFSCAPSPKRALGSTLVYILVLNAILPSMLHELGFDSAAALIFPPRADSAALQVSLALLQTGLIWALAWRRIGQRLSYTRQPDRAATEHSN